MTAKGFCEQHEDNNRLLSELSKASAVLGERIGNLCDAFEKHLAFNTQFMPQMQEYCRKIDAIGYKLDVMQQRLDRMEARMQEIEALRDEYAVINERVSTMWKWVMAAIGTGGAAVGHAILTLLKNNP